MSSLAMVMDAPVLMVMSYGLSPIQPWAFRLSSSLSTKTLSVEQRGGIWGFDGSLFSPAYAVSRRLVVTSAPVSLSSAGRLTHLILGQVSRKWLTQPQHQHVSCLTSLRSVGWSRLLQIVLAPVCMSLRGVSATIFAASSLRVMPSASQKHGHCRFWRVLMVVCNTQNYWVFGIFNCPVF
jgi:hypothetical protein